MEKYRGIKFDVVRRASSFQVDERLKALNGWAFVFGEMGLAPVHENGAFGNHSFRDGEETFVITRTGMVPKELLSRDDYCRVRYNDEQRSFQVAGRHMPSSECYLHAFIYKHLPAVNTVMHGHSLLLNRYSAELGLPQTVEEYPYGTVELAESAIRLLDGTVDFFIMKNHGFVAVGDDIEQTAKKVIGHYIRLMHRFL